MGKYKNLNTVKVFWKYLLNGDWYYFVRDEIIFSKQAANHEMQSFSAKLNCALILSFCWPNKSENNFKFSLSQYRCHKTPIDVKNCVKSALNSNHRKQNFSVITNWGGGDNQLRSVLAAKQIWVAVISIWGTLDSLPRGSFCTMWSNYSYMTEWFEHFRTRPLCAGTRGLGLQSKNF